MSHQFSQNKKVDMALLTGKLNILITYPTVELDNISSISPSVWAPHLQIALFTLFYTYCVCCTQEQKSTYREHSSNALLSKLIHTHHQATWRGVSSVCLAKVHCLILGGEVSLFIRCTQTNYTEFSVHSEPAGVLHVWLVLHVITDMHSMCFCMA